jgi:acetyltransferase
MILFGLGGIFIEVLKDVRTTLAPLSQDEVASELKQLKSYKLIQGVRGKRGLDENAFIEIIQRLSELALVAPEIVEMDLNPLLATENQVIAVDARIRLEKGV